MRTRASISIARPGACALLTLPWRNTISAIWRPIGPTGLNPVPHQVEEEHGCHREEGGKERDPPLARHDEAGAVGDHDAPFRHWRPHPEPDEREAGGVEDRVAEGQ